MVSGKPCLKIYAFGFVNNILHRYLKFKTKGIKQIIETNSKIDILLCLILKATKWKILFLLSFPFHVFLNFELLLL